MQGFIERLAALFAPLDAAGPAEASERVGPAPIATPALAVDDPRIPDTSRPKVARLLALAAEIEARGARDPLLAAAVGEARQMREEHLSRLVASYADIPASHRAEIFRATGRSASYNLNEAFDRMIARMEALSGAMAREDINSFADNLRFIDQRYGKGDPLP